MNFLLSTDTSCDVFRSELKKLGVYYTPLNYVSNGVPHTDEFSADSEYVEFYESLKNGAQLATSQVNAFVHEEFFDSILASTSLDIVHLSLSSGLSGTYQSALTGAKNSLEKFKGRQIHVIDTLSATQGHHYLLDEAISLRDKGASALDTVNHLNDVRHKIHHWLMVDDLIHLKKGGRIGGVTAYIGTVLNIKPIIAVDSEGKLSLISKVKGTKQSLRYFMQMMEEHGDDLNNSRIYIASGNSTELAALLKQQILTTYPNAQVIIGWIGPIIGTHTGNNTLGLVYKSTTRIPHK